MNTHKIINNHFEFDFAKLPEKCLIHLLHVYVLASKEEALKNLLRLGRVNKALNHFIISYIKSLLAYEEKNNIICDIRNNIQNKMNEQIYEFIEEYKDIINDKDDVTNNIQLFLEYQTKKKHLYDDYFKKRRTPLSAGLTIDNPPVADHTKQKIFSLACCHHLPAFFTFNVRRTIPTVATLSSFFIFTLGDFSSLSNLTLNNSCDIDSFGEFYVKAFGCLVATLSVITDNEALSIALTFTIDLIMHLMMFAFLTGGAKALHYFSKFVYETLSTLLQLHTLEKNMDASIATKNLSLAAQHKWQAISEKVVSTHDWLEKIEAKNPLKKFDEAILINFFEAARVKCKKNKTTLIEVIVDPNTIPLIDKTSP